MMMLILFVLGNALVVAYLIYGFNRYNRKAKELTKQIDASAITLKHLQETERTLREKIDTLQGHLSNERQEPLPGALSWSVFEDRLHQHILESTRYQLTMGIMQVQVNDFDLINDALGGDISHLLLGEVAERLRSCLRQVDCISRFDDDTFAVMLTRLTSPETAAVVVQRMLQVMERSFKVNGHEVNVEISIGVAIFPADGEEASNLLRCASHALALVKSKNGPSYQFYQEKMHQESRRELALYNSLSRDSVFQEFIIQYQPILNLDNETMVCMDVLLTWQHDEFGIISIEELFHYAERQHKWNNISEWLLRHAGQQFLQWRSFGVNPGLLGIHLSIKQLENVHFIHRLSQVMQSIQFNPKWLLIEIKESFSPVSFDVLEKSFNMLSYLGVNIAIENFGAGSMSLRYLKNFNIQFLKLDSAFVGDIVQNKQTQALVKSIVQLAESMSMRVMVAEIESEQQLAVLKELGCRLMQGQLLGAPLSEREVVDKLVS
jgi:diguanylate cyclase (GGDEF)-like protein